MMHSVSMLRALVAVCAVLAVLTGISHADRDREIHTVYVTESGSGDLTGSDFANARPWSHVRNELQSNTRYLFDGDIHGGMPQESNSLSSVVFDGAQGPSGQTLFRNDLTIDASLLSEPIDGVFAFELENRPPSIVWDYRQDDAAGTVTGISFHDSEIANAFDGMPVSVPARFAAWYGHLHPASVPASELQPGQWAYIDGWVYVAPPEAVDAAGFVQRARYIGRSRGLYLKASHNLTIRHIDFLGFGNPATQNGAVYTSGCTNIHLENLIAYDSGYRAFNLEGSTGSTGPLGIVVENCITAGDTIIEGVLANNPFVVYNREGCFDCDVLITGGGIAAYPWLDYLGRPLVGDPDGIQTPLAREYKPAGFYSHSGLIGVGMGGFAFQKFFVVSFSQHLNERHGLSLSWAAEGIGRINRAELPAPVIGTDPSTYPIRFEQCVFVCNPGPVQHIVFDRCRFLTPRPRGGLSSYADRINSWFPAPESVTSLYLRSCEIVLQQLNASPDNGLFRLVSQFNTLCLDLCTVVEITTANQFRVDSTIRSVDGATVRIRGCLFATTSPDGWNQHFLYRPAGAQVAIDYDPIAWSSIKVQSCWFWRYSEPRFAERYGEAWAAGLSYPEFINANIAGGASADHVTGQHLFGVDPDFTAAESGILRPADGSPVFSQHHTIIPELVGLLDLYGNPYQGRYGAVQRLIYECPGDVNGDGSVNLADLNLVLANFGHETDQGDLNGDGVVNLADLNIVLATFGSSCAD